MDAFKFFFDGGAITFIGNAIIGSGDLAISVPLGLNLSDALWPSDPITPTSSTAGMLNFSSIATGNYIIAAYSTAIRRSPSASSPARPPACRRPSALQFPSREACCSSQRDCSDCGESDAALRRSDWRSAATPQAKPARSLAKAQRPQRKKRSKLGALGVPSTLLSTCLARE